MPKEFWTFDCETDPFKYGRIPRPFIWGFFNGTIYREFTDTASAVKFMRQKDAIFYAHNGGKFDFHFMAEYITRNEKVMMINSRLVKAKIGRAEIRDSYALLPFPLAAYKKDDFDYTKLEENVRGKHMPEIREYLRNDCIYLYELIKAFFDEYGRHLTAPSAAIKIMQKMEGIKIENPGRYFFSEFQKHYFGGRCECLKPGIYTEGITYLDINSAYAFAMLHHHPIGDEWEFKHYKKPPIIPHQFYTIRAKSYGAFCRREKGLVFDWDGEERIYHTTGWEIKAALESGSATITEHIEQKFFAHTHSYEKFINYFWDKRQEFPKGTPQNLFCKLIPNSCYGKFSANPENYDTFVLFDPAIAQYLTENEWEIRGEIGPHIVASKPLDPADMRFYNVATGASITGFVRAMLMKAIKSVDKPIYCDTDSLVFQGECDIPMGKDLGQWKIEGHFNEAYFAGKKLYAVRNKKDDEIISSKGSRLSFNDVKKITKGETVKYNQDAPTFSWYKKIDEKDPLKLFTSRNIKRTAT